MNCRKWINEIVYEVYETLRLLLLCKLLSRNLCFRHSVPNILRTTQPNLEFIELIA